MKYRSVIGLATPLLLHAAAAHAAGSGTPLDAVATQIVTVLSGPVALTMVAAGFVGAGIVYFMSRDFGHAFITGRTRGWRCVVQPDPADGDVLLPRGHRHD